jgi:hypothetical protein
MSRYTHSKTQLVKNSLVYICMYAKNSVAYRLRKREAVDIHLPCSATKTQKKSFALKIARNL